MLTCRVFTVWNLTKRSGMCFPSFTVSSETSITWSTAGSDCDSTSSKPRAGRFVNNLINLGPSAGFAV